MTAVAHAHAFEHVQRHLAHSLGPLIGVALSDVSGDPQSLFPEERPAIAKAVLKRQQEFAAGRTAARKAMRDIGWRDMAIPCKADRSPEWPEGLTGSISHSKQACVAVVGRKAHVDSIGIDIEDQIPIDPDLWSAICTPQELAAVTKLPVATRGLTVTRIFSAKEAFYKWQYPLTGHLLDFHDVTIALDVSLSTFSAHCMPANVFFERFARAWGHAIDQQNLFVSVINMAPNDSLARPCILDY